MSSDGADVGGVAGDRPGGTPSAGPGGATGSSGAGPVGARSGGTGPAGAGSGGAGRAGAGSGGAGPARARPAGSPTPADYARRRLVVAAGIVAAVLLVAGAAVALRGGGAGDGDGVSADGPGPSSSATASTAAPAPPTTAPGPPTWPLTGVLVGDAAGADRPALVVKIDNAQPFARPQSGLNQADVVYEEMVEGSVTRFAAVFHSTGADPLGPVRSARSTDVPLVTPLRRPLYAWSGANPQFAALVRSSPLVDVGYEAFGGLYVRRGDRRAPYNLYSTTAALWGFTPEGSEPPPPLFEYRREGEAPAGREVSWVHVDFGTGPGSAPVDWAWRAEVGGWLRSQEGTPHVDEAGQQVAPANVVIQFVPYDIVGCCDASGFPIPEARLLGEGDAWLLSAGRLVEGRWHKPAPEAVTTWSDADGNPFRLTPGRTWVVLAPPGAASIVG